MAEESDKLAMSRDRRQSIADILLEKQKQKKKFNILKLIFKPENKETEAVPPSGKASTARRQSLSDFISERRGAINMKNELDEIDHSLQVLSARTAKYSPSWQRSKPEGIADLVKSPRSTPTIAEHIGNEREADEDEQNSLQDMHDINDSETSPCLHASEKNTTSDRDDAVDMPEEPITKTAKGVQQNDDLNEDANKYVSNDVHEKLYQDSGVKSRSKAKRYTDLKKKLPNACGAEGKSPAADKILQDVRPSNNQPLSKESSTDYRKTNAVEVTQVSVKAVSL